jgi:hypothetical protein
MEHRPPFLPPTVPPLSPRTWSSTARISCAAWPAASATKEDAIAEARVSAATDTTPAATVGVGREVGMAAAWNVASCP